VAAAPFLAPHGAAKAAVVSLTKTLASERGRTGVRVNALCLGWTATDLNRAPWDTPDGRPGASFSTWYQFRPF
jgi:NAD(P)-dependent dehydrogenase (short-subunit alcohol dehydrogenase family)